MPVAPFKNATPKIDPTVFIAPTAWIIGDVKIAAGCSIFFGAVLRGDIHPIRIGAGTNIQEHSLLHTSHEFGPVEVGEEVTIGHRAILHGCRVDSRTLIGMGATVLDDAVIGEGSIIGAHTLILKGARVPEKSLVVGSPGKVLRTVTDAELAGFLGNSRHYQELGAYYLKQEWGYADR